MLGVIVLETVGSNRPVSETAEEGIRRSAEAVVDAALCCQYYLERRSVSQETREALIAMVLGDPLLTAHVFCKDALSRSWC